MNWFIPEWLVALSLTLFVLDIFLMTEVLSWGGVLSLSVWLTWRIDAPFKWAIIVFSLSFTTFAFMYVLLLRNVIGTFVRHIMQRNAPDEALYSLVGRIGEIRHIGGKTFLYVDGEMWPVSPECEPLDEGTKAKAISIRDGEVWTRIVA